MKENDRYVANEAVTFPLFCLVCMAFNVYWGCADGWPVGAIIGTLFFGIVVMYHIGKYICYGRNYLKIDAYGIEIKDWKKITKFKWSEIKKCEVYDRHAAVSASLFVRDLMIVAKSENGCERQIFVSLSGKYCCNRSVIKAIEHFGGNDVFDGPASRRQNGYLTGILLITVLAIILLVLISCNNRHDLTDNYSVFTYGEGLYGENEQDYPIFASKLGYAEEPKYIPNVRQVWWNDGEIIIEQDNDLWWIITAVNKKLTAGDTFHGPLSRQQKDSIVAEYEMNPQKMKHSNYE